MSEDVTSEGVAAEELKQFIERAERIQEDIDNYRNGMKELKAELKGRGFDVKAFNSILKLRKIDHAERQEMEAILELYMQAVGMA